MRLKHLDVSFLSHVDRRLMRASPGHGESIAFLRGSETRICNEAE